MQNEDISEEINLPVEILNEEEYVKELRRLLDLFNKKIKKMKISKEVIIDIETKCKRIIDIIDHVNDEPLAAEYLDELIIKCIMDIKSDPFIVSALNKSYAFRGLAPFEYFHVLDEKSGKYSERMKDELTFFRGRLCNGDELRNVKEIISLPASKIEKVGNQRFSEKGKICLYLGATTYVCARECRWGKYENDMLNISRFHIEDRKDEIQVLNLAISEPLLNGIGTIISRNEQGEKSYLSMLRIFPLVIASSFFLRDENKSIENNPLVYWVSQSIIRCVEKLGISGIAYVSKRGEAKSINLLGHVNLVLLANDIDEGEEYSRIYDKICCCRPIAMHSRENLPKKSYYNKWFFKELSSVRNAEGCNTASETENGTSTEIDCIKGYSMADFMLIDEILVRKELVNLGMLFKRK